jgi:hypothetical protein
LSELGRHYESQNLRHGHRIWNSVVGHNLIFYGHIFMEMKILTLAIVVIIGLLILWATILLVREYFTMQNRVANLEKGFSDIQIKMKNMEEANRKRMPYDAFDSLLDARAALNRFREENKFFDSLIENAEAHIDKAMATGTKRQEK